MSQTILEVLQFNAPPHRVFEAFTHQNDARKGGKWRMGCKEDGYVASGEVVELIPDELLVYTWRIKDYDTKSGKRVPNFSDGMATKVTLTFEKIAGGTKVAVRHEGSPDLDEQYLGHQVSWELRAGEVLKYYPEHRRPEFERWWKENETAWHKRHQTKLKARLTSDDQNERLERRDE